MKARIYKPARNAMTSGAANTRDWVLEFVPEITRDIDPLMGWTSSSETQPQVRLCFDSLDAARDYAERRGIDVIVTRPQSRRANVRPGGYGDNFATGRRGAWTH